MAEGVLQIDAAEDELQQQGKRLGVIDFASRKAEETSLRRYDAAGWLRKMVGVVAGRDFPAQPSEEEFRLGLRSGIVLCNALNKVQPGAVPKVVEAPSDSVVVPDGAALLSFQYFENVRNFLDSVEEMGIPAFEASDLEQGGKTSRIVNCVLALKSYHDWKEGGGKGLWKFSGNSKPPSAGKQFVRKNADLFMNSLSKNSSFVEKSLDCSLIHQNSSGDLEQDLYEMDNSNSLHMFVRQLLSDKKPDDIPVIVENLLSKFVEEFQNQFTSHNEQGGTTFRDMDVRSSKENVEIEAGTSSSDLEASSFIDHADVEVGTTSRDMDVPSSNKHVDIEAGTTLRDIDVSSPNKHAGMTMGDMEVPSPNNHVDIEASKIMENRSRSENSKSKNLAMKHPNLVNQHLRKSKQLALKRQHLVEQHQRSLQEIKNTLHTSKEDLHILRNKYQEEVQSLGKHLNVLAIAASRYQKVLEENCKLYNQVQDLKGNIRVYCRIRTFLPGQPAGLSTVEAIDEHTLAILTPAKNGKGKKLITFNRVFGPSASQEQVFSDTQPLIRSVLDGYSVCIFAYGQTGSGKTYTMTGPKELTSESIGVNYRALNDLFSILEQRKDSISYDVSVQMIEIYNEQVRDLLVNEEIRNNSQNGIDMANASFVPVTSTSDAINLMDLGHKNRTVGSTSMDDRSSRSHSCVTVHVQGRNLTSGSITRGCMHLVDLAGSERAGKNDAVGDSLKVDQYVNRSLSALGDVIFALAQKQSHVPYRNSKLTELLQDSLGDQSKTLMFIHLSPEPDALGETISTLKFAERVSTVETGSARSTKESADVRELKEQISSLKAALLRKERGESINQQSRSMSPDRLTVGSFASSPAPSWQSIGDFSRTEVQSECSSISRMQSFDPQDFMESPSWSSLNSPGSMDDWANKDMVKYNISKVYPEQQLNKACPNRKNSLENGLGRCIDESYDLEAETCDSSELDYRLQNNVSRSNNMPNGGGPKARKPTPKQVKIPEIRSLIPQPPTRRASSGSHSPLQKAGKKPASTDGKRKPAMGK